MSDEEKLVLVNSKHENKLDHGQDRDKTDGSSPSQESKQEINLKPISSESSELSEEQKSSKSIKCNNKEPTKSHLSNVQCLMHLVKGNMGPGIMALPLAVEKAGLWVGFFGLLAVGVITTHCMQLLVKSAQHLSEKMSVKSLDYGLTVEAAFKTGPTILQKHCTKASSVINWLLSVMQIGFCCVYIVFISRNVQQIVENNTGSVISIRVYELAVILCISPFGFIKSLKVLAPFSFVANILMLTSLVILFFHILQGLNPSEDFPAFEGWAGIPLFLGSAIFTFEGIAVVLPIENEMRYPESYGGLTGVLTLGMVIVTVMYTSVGFFGYLKYGFDQLQGSITLNLPTTFIYSGVRIAYATAIFFTFSLQLYVPVNIIWPHIHKKVNKETYIQHGENLVRVMLLLLIFTLAITIPYLDKFTSLVGSLCCASISFFFPALIHIVTFWEVPGGLGVGNWHLFKDIAIMLFAVIVFVTGTYASMEGIIECFNNPLLRNCKK